MNIYQVKGQVTGPRNKVAGSLGLSDIIIRENGPKYLRKDGHGWICAKRETVWGFCTLFYPSREKQPKGTQLLQLWQEGISFVYIGYRNIWHDFWQFNSCLLLS